MGNYAIVLTFENPRRGRLARDFTTNVPKILDLKSSSEQIFSENCRWVPLYHINIFTFCDMLGLFSSAISIESCKHCFAI